VFLVNQINNYIKGIVKMAILYTLVVDNPTLGEVDIFPPTVSNSDWLKKLVKETQSLGFIVNAGIASSGNQFIIFDSETDLNNFLSANRLTDPALIADLNEWKTAHNIKYITKAYSLTSTPVSVVPLF
jgi:hypothetical protein